MPTLERPDATIYYEVVGAGPAIAFMTGMGGDLRIWREAGYVSGLEGYQRILIDQRGRGRSSRPDTIDAHELPLYVGDIEAVLDTVGVERVAFWGYSAGVLAGVAFGAARPNRLSALIGLGSLPYRDFTDASPVPDADEFIREMVRTGGVRAEVDARMREESDRFPEAIDRNVRETDPRMNALDSLAWRRWRGPKSVYPTFAAPVLMVAGEREDPDRNTERAVAALPNGRVVRLTGHGHLAAFYRSDLTLPYAIPFLRAHVR